MPLGRVLVTIEMLASMKEEASIEWQEWGDR